MIPNYMINRDKDYEVYIYFDPRYSGTYKYNELEYKFKPVYVGKGKISRKRINTHLKKSSNKRLYNLINKLNRDNIKPYFEIINTNLLEIEALKLETYLIKSIGRDDINLGPLFNLTDGDTERRKIIYTPELLEKRRKRMQDFFDKMTIEEKKQYAQKSLRGRTKENTEKAAKKRKETINNWSIDKRRDIEKRRYNTWFKNYYNRSTEQREITCKKCSIASQKKKIYFIAIENLNTGIIESKFLREWIKQGYARDGIMYRIKAKSQKPLYSRTMKQDIRVLSWKIKSPNP